MILQIDFPLRYRWYKIGLYWRREGRAQAPRPEASESRDRVSMNWLYARMSMGIAVCLVYTLQAGNLFARQNAEPANATGRASAEPSTVMSARRLEPTLHGGHRRVKFSPDGKYVLAQDDSG